MSDQAVLPNGRWRLADSVLWLLPIIGYLVFPAHRLLASQVLITALFALSLDLVLGYAGIVSLGHAAFFGVGAYTAALLAAHGWAEPLSGLALAGVAAALLGYATSFLVIRGRALVQLMITVGVGSLVLEAANKASDVTGGSDGLSISMSPLLGKFSFDLAGNTAFWYSFVVALIAFVAIKRLISSPFGLSLVAIRENTRRMPALGAPVGRRLVAAFTVGAGLAGIAGGLLAQTTQQIGVEILSFDRSAGVLIMLALGGPGRMYGAFVGAALYMVLQDGLSRLNPVYWPFWIGLLLVFVVVLGRGGVVGGIEAAVAAIRRRRRGAAA